MNYSSIHDNTQTAVFITTSFNPIQIVYNYLTRLQHFTETHFIKKCILYLVPQLAASVGSSTEQTIYFRHDV